MEGVTKQFRELSFFENQALDVILREVNPAAIFRAIQVYFAVEADCDLRDQGPQYQKVMRTLEEACLFVLEVIESDWGADSDLKDRPPYAMEPHCYELEGDQSWRLMPFLEELVGREKGIAGAVIWAAHLRDECLVRRSHPQADELNASVRIHVNSAAKQVADEWKRILEPPFDYHVYLRSPEWKAKRNAQVAVAGGRCQVCNSAKQLNCHHRTYERIGNELPDDLFVLCADCHQIFHDNGRLARPQ